MYVSPNFKTKKALKEAVANGDDVGVFFPGPFHCPQNGTVAIKGPHYPKAHSWYAQVKVEAGLVKGVS